MQPLFNRSPRQQQRRAVVHAVDLSSKKDNLSVIRGSLHNICSREVCPSHASNASNVHSRPSLSIEIFLNKHSTHNKHSMMCERDGK